ncbi:MAG: hypothetical protein K2J63_09770 [Muribaculaceae bacterium]|nr:hypothetical protein [Muribaculaceae bacterium]
MGEVRCFTHMLCYFGIPSLRDSTSWLCNILSRCEWVWEAKILNSR